MVLYKNPYGAIGDGRPKPKAPAHSSVKACDRVQDDAPPTPTSPITYLSLSTIPASSSTPASNVLPWSTVTATLPARESWRPFVGGGSNDVEKHQNSSSSEMPMSKENVQLNKQNETATNGPLTPIGRNGGSVARDSTNQVTHHKITLSYVPWNSSSGTCPSPKRDRQREQLVHVGQAKEQPTVKHVEDRQVGEQAMQKGMSNLRGAIFAQALQQNREAQGCSRSALQRPGETFDQTKMRLFGRTNPLDRPPSQPSKQNRN